jgi:hypothetical protein
MGDNLLMKNLILILFLLVTSTLISDELSLVDEQVQSIKLARKGMQNCNLNIIKDPFIFLAKDRGEEDSLSVKKPIIVKIKISTTKHSTQTDQVSPAHEKSVNKVLTLELIMNNAARINGFWYKLDDKVNGYKITKLDRSTVLLTKKKKQIFLSTKSIRKNLTFLR